MTDAIFLPQDGHFVPTKRAGSPWGDEVLHGGPPAGLLAGAIERFVDDAEMQVCRFTIDLFRPVPMAPLTVSTRTVRAGRRIHVVESTLRAEGVDVCRATGLLLRATTGSGIQPVGAISPPPGPDGIESSVLGAGVRSAGPRRQGFHTTAEIRRVPAMQEGGPAAAWISIPVLMVAGEAITPLVRAAATSDFVNAIGGINRPAEMGTINADTTLYLQRPPRGEWIALQVERSVEATGLGVSAALVFDVDGLVGRATQAVLANRMT